MIFSFTLPFLGVLILNAKIGFRVCKAQSLARQQQDEETRGGGTGTSDEDTYAPRRDSRPLNSALLQKLAEGSVSSSGGGLDRLMNDAELLAQLDTARRSSAARRGSGTGGRHRRGRRDKIERRVTQLLVTVSLAYLVLNLPSYAHRVVVAFESTSESDSGHNYKTPLGVVAETISYLMFYTQFSVNFFLYSCHGCMFGFNC